MRGSPGDKPERDVEEVDVKVSTVFQQAKSRKHAALELFRGKVSDALVFDKNLGGIGLHVLAC